MSRHSFTAASPCHRPFPADGSVRPTTSSSSGMRRSSNRSQHGLEEQVRRHSTRLAVKTRGEALTYDALNRAANRVASAILARRRETGAEPVALLLEQGAQAIAAMLGVLKAGKTHVGLDPAHPRARTDLALENAQPGLLVTNRKHLPWRRSSAAGHSPRSTSTNSIPHFRREPGVVHLPGRTGLHPVHVRLDRYAEGGRSHPPQPASRLQESHQPVPHQRRRPLLAPLLRNRPGHQEHLHGLAQRGGPRSVERHRGRGDPPGRLLIERRSPSTNRAPRSFAASARL